MSSVRCYHCDEPVPANASFSATIDGVAQPMCCPGCAAVADAIVAAGLSDYYRYRTEKGQQQDVPEALASLIAYDLDEVQQEFVAARGDLKEVLLSVEGISCAACAWLIEKHLAALPGVAQISVNTTTQRAVLRWDASQQKLSDLLLSMNQIGYQAAPFQQDAQEAKNARESQNFLLRIGLAGLATMQVMMLAVALYTGYFYDLEPEYRDYFRWVSMIFATPVVLYSAQPFYFSALRALMSLRVNMDVPVSIAILLAYVASCVATARGTGEVFFESISMFTFFLLVGRFFEQRARRKASENASNLQKLIPATALLLEDGDARQVAAKSLKPGQVYRVLPGQRIAVDGVLLSGQSGVNESMLTGEQEPVQKQPGAPLYAGTVNLDQTIEVEVTKVGAEQRINTLVRLQEQAAAQKPQIAEFADRVAQYFVPVILVLALVTYLVWHQLAPEDAFWIMLSVLVATCPCALALATPAALTCGTNRMMQQGLLVKSARVLEALPRIQHLLFDKTGTLTEGQLSVKTVHGFDGAVSETQLLALAAALESHSSHPVARAFALHRDASIQASDVNNHTGQGLEGVIHGQHYRIGQQAFVGTDLGQSGWVFLARDGKVIGAFELADRLRSDAADTISKLSGQGLKCEMLSGDPNPRALELAEQVGLKTAHYGCSPEQKLARVAELQRQGCQVAMFGDGINDAPVLAGANVSVAMGSGTDLAKCHADLVLLGDKLAPVVNAIETARQTNRVIRQNLAISLCYNLLILPLAVSGNVPPYLAAAGMSLSSLVVVANSLRLLKKTS
ncbi:heavy metal translocating P-type ATPase [Ferrimonas balearica]|uniref:heavy metal translocating P-type ATPase n=1 Tax=Ferrimonas balearica TaxID=44012 RepID=UPI001C5749BC|nr:heavy metal translocating P-type ATPase [Ferrimonas balearica]MBW3163387.1 cadmium-translocating P-type ATPase [Ferrimonas balearica]